MPDQTAAPKQTTPEPTTTPALESGFDNELGNLTLGGVIYVPRKYTVKLERSLEPLDKEATATARQALGPLLGKLGETATDEQRALAIAALTEDESDAMMAARRASVDVRIKQLVELYHTTGGERPDADVAIEELSSDEIAEAVMFAMANPTSRSATKTAATSS
jgi:hypothetical protein